jgi:dsDNA-specific endonuclease/ATPase MutS2
MLYKYLPTLDLHGEITQTVDLIIKSFILENYKLGNRKVVIVHGIGSGLLRKAVHHSLAANKLILNYKLDMFNIGSTIVEINVDNNY